VALQGVLAFFLLLEDVGEVAAGLQLVQDFGTVQTPVWGGCVAAVACAALHDCEHGGLAVFKI
jgi:hypothetical protein